MDSNGAPWVGLYGIAFHAAMANAMSEVALSFWGEQLQNHPSGDDGGWSPSATIAGTLLNGCSKKFAARLYSKSSLVQAELDG
jgi:hypothetical protein